MKLSRFVVSAVLLTAVAVTAQEQRGKATATVAGKKVEVEYGRPVLAGRDMLGQAQPGVAWRMGAGSPTSLSTETDLSFGSVTVPKGKYILTAQKDDKDAWTMTAKKAEGGDKVADIPLATSTNASPVDQFTIDLTGKGDTGEFAMSWGTKKMTAAFKAK